MGSSAPILILAATEAEIRGLGGDFAAPQVGSEPAARSGEIGGQAVEAAVTGVGKASAAFTAGFLLARTRYRALVSFGSAGAFSGTGLSVGDVVIADREILADEGALAPQGFLDLEAMGLAAFLSEPPVRNAIPIHPPFRLSSREIAEMSRALGFTVRAGPLATVSTCSGTEGRAAEIFARWRPLAESMEGAALALAALGAGTPFLEVRGISNWTGDRERARWDIPLALERAQAAVRWLLARADAWRTAP